MKTQLNILILIAVAVSAAACNRGVAKKPEPVVPASVAEPAGKSSKVELKYWFILDGCSTEKHTFTSKADMCAGLQDRGLNRGCALDLRKAEFTKAACDGEFKEVAGKSMPGTLSPVRCVGQVSGFAGSKKIDRVIEWDRKTYQKVVLSGFKEVPDAGEISLHLAPAEDGAPPLLALRGWFIDNNKNQDVTVFLGSTARYTHKDPSRYGRSVEIECGLELEDAPPAVVEDLPVRMTCFGVFGKIEGGLSPVDGTFEWNGKDRQSTMLNLREQSGGSTGIEITLDRDSSGKPVLEARAIGLNGHVDFTAQSKRDLYLNVSYLSAWDNAKVEFSCQTARAWNKMLNDFVEKSKEKEKQSGEKN